VGSDICVDLATYYKAGVSRSRRSHYEKEKVGKAQAALSRLRNEENHNGSGLGDMLRSKRWNRWWVIGATEPTVLIVTLFEHVNSGKVRQLCWLRQLGRSRKVEIPALAPFF
jgi:hypothetical protein